MINTRQLVRTPKMVRTRTVVRTRPWTPVLGVLIGLLLLGACGNSLPNPLTDQPMADVTITGTTRERTVQDPTGSGYSKQQRAIVVQTYRLTKQDKTLEQVKEELIELATKDGWAFDPNSTPAASAEKDIPGAHAYLSVSVSQDEPASVNLVLKAP